MVTLVALTAVGAIWHYGKQLAQPERKTLEEYHYKWLNNPENHGISIITTTHLEEKVPCLIVTPDSSSHLGERGKIIRQQLTEQGYKLKDYGTILGTVLLLHGRNGRKEDLLPIAERFCAVGFRCILPDLPAHGESPIKTVQFGNSNWEQELPYQLLLECASSYDFSATPAALWGMSMGGSFATHSASTGAPWTSVVIVSSFDRLSNVLANKCPLSSVNRALGWTCKQFGGAHVEHVNPCEKAKRITIPTMVAHGTNDSLIKLYQGKALYDSFASSEKQWVEVNGGTHSNILTTPMPPMPLYATMISWILTHLTN